jgi:hypothetical protein
VSRRCNGVEREFPHASNVVVREGEHPAFMEAVVLDACHSIWIFDLDRKRYSRILRGLERSSRRVASEWRSYSYLEIDESDARFSLFLGADRSRIIRSWIHTHDCRQCAVRQTTDFWMEDLREALSVAHHSAPMIHITGSSFTRRMRAASRAIASVTSSSGVRLPR